MEEKNHSTEVKLKEANEKLQKLRTNIVALLQKVQEVTVFYILHLKVKPKSFLCLVRAVKKTFSLCVFRTLT